MLDNPKSAIFTFAWASRRRFSGLRSLDYITKKTITNVKYSLGKKTIPSFLILKNFFKVSLIKMVEVRICRGYSGNLFVVEKQTNFPLFAKCIPVVFYNHQINELLKLSLHNNSTWFISKYM